MPSTPSPGPPEMFALVLASAFLLTQFAAAEDSLPSPPRNYIMDCYQCYTGLEKCWAESPDPEVRKLNERREYCSRRLQDLGLGDEPARSDFTMCLPMVQAALNGSAPAPKASVAKHCQECMLGTGDYIRAHVDPTYEIPEVREVETPLIRPPSERTKLFEVFYNNTYNLILMVFCALCVSVALILLLAATGAIRLHCTRGSRVKVAEELRKKAEGDKQWRAKEVAETVSRESAKPAEAVAEAVAEATDGTEGK